MTLMAVGLACWLVGGTVFVAFLLAITREWK
jgi:hypothetical protein